MAPELRDRNGVSERFQFTNYSCFWQIFYWTWNAETNPVIYNDITEDTILIDYAAETAIAK